jgi:hypothetical protein
MGNFQKQTFIECDRPDKRRVSYKSRRPCRQPSHFVVSAAGVAHCVEIIIGIWTEEKSRENFSFFRDVKK